MNKQIRSYKIEISITQDANIGSKKPYYWILWGLYDEDWINECCGWAEKPQLAWSDAYNFYNSFKVSTI